MNCPQPYQLKKIEGGEVCYPFSIIQHNESARLYNRVPKNVGCYSGVSKE